MEQDETWSNYPDMAGRYWMSHQYHLGCYFWCVGIPPPTTMPNANAQRQRPTSTPNVNAQRQRPRRRQRRRGSGAMGGGARWTAAVITMDGGGAIAMDGGDAIGQWRMGGGTRWTEVARWTVAWSMDGAPWWWYYLFMVSTPTIFLGRFFCARKQAFYGRTKLDFILPMVLLCYPKIPWHEKRYMPYIHKIWY